MHQDSVWSLCDRVAMSGLVMIGWPFPALLLNTMFFSFLLSGEWGSRGCFWLPERLLAFLSDLAHSPALSWLAWAVAEWLWTELIRSAQGSFSPDVVSDWHTAAFLSCLEPEAEDCPSRQTEGQKLISLPSRIAIKERRQKNFTWYRAGSFTAALVTSKERLETFSLYLLSAAVFLGRRGADNRPVTNMTFQQGFLVLGAAES